MTFSLFKEVIMMKKLALVAAGFLCTGLLGACSNQGMESSNKSETKQTSTMGPSEQAGKKVQEFNLQGVDGKTYRLSDYKGKESLPQILGFLVLYLPIDIRGYQ